MLGLIPMAWQPINMRVTVRTVVVAVALGILLAVSLNALIEYLARLAE